MCCFSGKVSLTVVCQSQILKLPFLSPTGDKCYVRLCLQICFAFKKRLLELRVEAMVMFQSNIS